MYTARLNSFGAMIADEARNDALAAAVQAIVSKGDIVIDLGAGCALLSILAARSGAAAVYSIEADPFMAEVARQTIEENGCTDRVTVIAQHSQNWDPPEPADVLISETLGFAIFDEGLAPTLADGCERFLKPKGRIVPNRLEITAALACAPLVAIPDQVHGVLIKTLKRLLSQCFHRVELKSDQIISRPIVLADYCTSMLPEAPTFARTCSFKTVRSGCNVGLAIWFSAALTGELTLTNNPLAVPTHWGQTFLPFCEEAATLGEDEAVECEIRMLTKNKRLHFDWSARRVAGEDR
ncbi:MAG: 50S ribosomal protein L11 methyltransferase [Planctomycetota bacterium]